MQDFHVLDTSPARNAAGALPAAVAAYPLNREYRKHQASVPRHADALLDIGAYEYAVTEPPPAPPTGLIVR
jgi:hypothetical protein